MLALAIGLLAQVVLSLRSGTFDARAKGVTEPDLVHAADSPVMFYGSQAFVALLAIFGIVLTLQMLREMLPLALRRR
jgi:hypothetical protein